MVVLVTFVPGVGVRTHTLTGAQHSLISFFPFCSMLLCPACNIDKQVVQFFVLEGHAFQDTSIKEEKKRVFFRWPTRGESDSVMYAR